ncbi:hypothetical protein V9K67_03760 [Paraflavisolibacter sp. H34]|uniref:hypothetical protein n=1 Tax=Huijunlia imazamoxiresistens TaxID=3127457 RepID=UPI003018F361
MARKQPSRFAAYRDRRNTERSPQTGNINARNNNENNTGPRAEAPNVETANDAGIGDSGLNRQRLTNYTQNHSADA